LLEIHARDGLRRTVPVFKKDLVTVLSNLGADDGLYGAGAMARREARVYPEIPDAAKLQGDRFGP
jgi:hypothetical protein